MTTTQAKAGRGGGVCSDKKAIMAVMRITRKTLASLAVKLETMLDEGFEGPTEKETADRMKTIQGLTLSMHRAMQTVIDIEDQIHGRKSARIPDPPVLNMDEARAEIERRLARLAA